MGLAPGVGAVLALAPSMRSKVITKVYKVTTFCSPYAKLPWNLQQLR